jgi:hypothetical protein
MSVDQCICSLAVIGYSFLGLIALQILLILLKLELGAATLESSHLVGDAVLPTSSLGFLLYQVHSRPYLNLSQISWPLLSLLYCKRLPG